MTSKNPDAWSVAKRIFRQALEISPAQRESFLTEACGSNLSLRAEVDSLLRFDAAAGDAGFLGQPRAFLPLSGHSIPSGPAATSTFDRTNTEGRKRSTAPFRAQIGRYEIRGCLGDGGFGTVYRGYDADLDREVAIKVLREDRNSGVAERERQIAEARMVASLEHPPHRAGIRCGTDGEWRSFCRLEAGGRLQFAAAVEGMESESP